MKWTIMTDGYYIDTVPDCHLEYYESIGWRKVSNPLDSYLYAKQEADKMAAIV